MATINLYSNPAAGSSDIFDNDRLVEQVANYYDWHRLYSNSSFFALLNNLGRIGGIAGTEVLINTDTELPHKIEGASSKTLTIPALDAVSSDFINLNDFAGGTAYNQYKPGNAFYFQGTSDGTASGSSDGDIITGLVRVDEVNSDGHVKFRTLSITNDGSAGTTVLDDDVRSVVLLQTSVYEYNSDAPDFDKFRPGKDVNYVQLFRRPLGSSLFELSTPATYDNSMRPMMLEQADMLNMEIERMLLFGMDGRAAADSTYRDSITVGGTSYNFGVSKGVPGFLKTDDLANSDAINSIVTGGSFDWHDLQDFADKFTVGSERKFGVASPAFITKMVRAAEDARETVRTETIDFPRVQWKMTEFEIGPIRLTMLRCRNLAWQQPLITDGTNTVTKDNFMYVIDPEYIKTWFADIQDLGVMTPRIFDIAQVNNKFEKKQEWVSAASVEMHKIASHGVFGVSA